MVTLHPRILEQDGKKLFAVLPYEEFQQIQEALNDFEDLKALREAKLQEAAAPVAPLAEIRGKLGI